MDSRNERALLAQLEAWKSEGKYREMADAVLYLPAGDRSAALMTALAGAYMGLGEYEKAIHTLEGIFEEEEESPDFQRQLGEAWYGKARGLAGEAREDALENAWFCAERARLLGSGEAVALAEAVLRDYGRPMYEVYEDADRGEVLEHISRYFGPIAAVWEEAISIGAKLDLAIIPPHGDQDYYTAVTVGLGAHRMDVPEELREYRIERAELAIALPEDWRIEDSREEWYWPMQQLKRTARIGLRKGAWLGWGHTIDCGPVAAGTGLSGLLLVAPQRVEEAGYVCALPGGDEVNFYQLIPLYPEEVAYKQKHGAEALLDRLARVSFVVDPHRWHPLEHRMAYDAAREDILDEADWRIRTVRAKHLAVGEIAVYGHQAIYLRWCIEQGLMSADFERKYAAVTEAVRTAPETAALREFVRDELSGVIRRSYFTREGQDFSRYYYEWGRAPYYPSDVDDMAFAYFGEQYHSQRFDDEAYLFIPYDETYYQRMKEVMDRRWAAWQAMRTDREDPAAPRLPPRPEMTCVAAGEIAAGEPVRYARREAPCGEDSGWRLSAEAPRDGGSDDGVSMTLAEALDRCPELVEVWDAPAGAQLVLAQDGHFRPMPYTPPEDASRPPAFAEEFMEALGCRAQYFPPMRGDDRLTAAWGYARRIGLGGGMLPVFLEADEALLAHIRAVWEKAGGREECVRARLAEALPDENALFPRRSFLARLFSGAAVMEGGEAVNGWPCLSEGGRTKAMILVRLFVERPEEVFAWLPAGGFGDPPDTARLMGAAAHWAEAYGAVPAAITGGGLAFRLFAPIARGRAIRAAEELSSLCPALLAGRRLGALADGLSKSHLWMLPFGM